MPQPPPSPKPAPRNPAATPSRPSAASPMQEQQRQLTYLLVAVLVVGVLILGVLVLIYFKPGPAPTATPPADAVASSATPGTPTAPQVPHDSTTSNSASTTPPVAAAAHPPAPNEQADTNSIPTRVASASSGVGAPFIAPIGRSPIPQPGESFDKPIDVERRDEPHAPTRSASGSGAATASGKSLFEAAKAEAPDKPVPWYEAGKYEGQSVTVEGKIIDTRRGNKVVFLNFSRDRDSFYVILFEKALDGWPDVPEKYFRDKTIRVTGKVVPYEKRMQIQVKNEYQIKVVE